MGDDASGSPLSADSKLKKTCSAEAQIVGILRDAEKGKVPIAEIQRGEMSIAEICLR